MDDYTELVRALRETDVSDGCPCEAADMCRTKDCVIIQAANVIEKMQKERTTKNINKDYNEVDQFVCEKCGIELQGWNRVERDEDDGDVTYYEYTLRYCPNCGAKVDKGATK